MIFRYNTTNAFIYYENIEPIAQIKLLWTIDYENKPIMANYQGNIEYFYAQQITYDDENFDVNQYILSLPIIDIVTFSESIEISEICSNRKIGQLQNYLTSQAFTQEFLSLLPPTTTVTSTTVTSTTVTTTPCPTGVPSRMYYINATNICAICVATNEFVCSPYENYNYVSCLNSVNSYNSGNVNCTIVQVPTTTSTTSTTPIGPQG